MPKLKDDAGVAAVLAARAARSPAPTPAYRTVDGAHVWAASGLVGFAGGQPVNTWAYSGLKDAFSSLRANTHQPGDWVAVVANEINAKENVRG